MFTRTILAAAAIASTLVAPHLAAHPEPPALIPLEQTSDILQADVTAAALAYERRFVDLYLERNDHDPALHKQIIDALELGVKWFAGAPDAPTTLQFWRPTALLVRNHACKDPMIGALYLHAQAALGQNTAATLRRAIDIAAAFERSTYPVHRRAMLYFVLGDLYTHNDVPDQAANAYGAAVSALLESLTEEDLTPLEQRHLLARVTARLRSQPLSSARLLHDALENHPQIDPWLRDVAAGEWHVRRAWDYRGSGWAHQVTPEGWKAFRRHLDQARTRLTRAYEIDPTRPEAPTRMITVAMAGHAAPGETIYTWFDRAVAAQFDYQPAYDRMLWALRPRWRGSHEAMLELGRRCAASERYDTIVPFQFVRAAQSIGADLANPDDVWRMEGLFDELAPVLERIVNEHRPYSPERMPYAAMLAGIAWHAGNYKIARRAIANGVEPFEARYEFNVVNAARELVTAESIILTSSLAETYLAAQAAAAEGQWSRSREMIENASPQVRESEAIEPLRHVLATARFMEVFHADDAQWFSFFPASNLPGWNRIAGAWNPYREGNLGGRPTDVGLLALMDANIGSRYELRGTIDLSRIREGWSGNAGFILDYRREGARNQFVSVRVLGASNRISVASRFQIGDASPLPPPVDPEQPMRHHVHISVWDNSLVVRVNDQRVFAGPNPLLRTAPHNGRIGLGGFFRTGNVGDVRFSDLQIRRLTERPPELPPPRQIDWEELLDLIPPDHDDDLEGIARAPSSPITLTAFD